jgi:hypothetical protein
VTPLHLVQGGNQGILPAKVQCSAQCTLHTRGGRDQFFLNEAIRGEFSARNGKRYGIRGEF